jgi:hypothetical protein
VGCRERRRSHLEAHGRDPPGSGAGHSNNAHHHRHSCSHFSGQSAGADCAQAIIDNVDSRGDNATIHVIDYDPTTGLVLAKMNYPQGRNASNGCWSRGQGARLKDLMQRSERERQETHIERRVCVCVMLPINRRSLCSVLMFLVCVCLLLVYLRWYSVGNLRLHDGLSLPPQSPLSFRGSGTVLSYPQSQSHSHSQFFSHALLILISFSWAYE